MVISLSIREGDFVEVEYTGRVTEGNLVFDTTSGEVAKQNKVYDQNASYGPVIVCVGAGHLLKGLDSWIVGKEPGLFRVHLTAEESFGKKNVKLLQMISASKFKSQNIQPFPGLQVNVDGMIGTVKTVSGGRIVVDFNHPLAGKDLDYEVSIKRTVSDAREKLNALMKFYFKDFSVTIEVDSAIVGLKNEVPPLLKGKLGEEVKKLIPEIKSVEFKVKV